MSTAHIGMDAVGFEGLDVSTSAVGVDATVSTPDVTAPVNAALVTIETAAARWRIDGSDPTASVGHLLDTTAHDLVILGSNNVRRFRVIRDAGADAKLFVSYYR